MEKSHPKKTAILAVLPFEGYSQQNDRNHLVSGFAEDIIVDLSRYSGLEIIAPYTSQLLAAAERDLFEAAREINIDYLLKGTLSFRKATLRITIQLLSTSYNKILWAQRYDAPLDTIFEILDHTVEQVVCAIQSEVEHDLLTLARTKPPSNLEAYDCWLRGMEQLGNGTLEADRKARSFFHQALEMDPHYSRAYAGLSLSHFNEWSCQLWDLYEESEKSAYTYAKRAVQYDDTDHLVHMILGRVYIYRQLFDDAEHHIMKSLLLNGSDADNLIQLASCLTFLGRVAEGERLVTKALELNPYRNLWYYQYASFVYFAKKDYSSSIQMALKRQLSNVWVDLPGYIAAAHAHLGQIGEAKPFLDMFKYSFQTSIMKGRASTHTDILDWVKLANPFKYQEDTDNIINGLLLAGIEKSATPSPQTPPQPKTEPTRNTAIFKREQNIWRLQYKGVEIALTNMKGLEDISQLLQRPDSDMHCTELMGTGSSMDENHTAIDDKALQAYKQHLQDLERDISEAEEMNDLSRCRILKEEYEELNDHLISSLGIGKRPRKLNSMAERARAAVTLRIKNAIKKISSQHSSLGKHLANSIHTGVYCRYAPEISCEWIVE